MVEGSVIAAAATADTMRAMETNLPTGTRLSVSIVLHHSSLEMLERVLRSLQRASRVAHEASRVERVQVEILDNSSDPDFRQRAASAIAAWPSDEFFSVVYQGLADNRGFGAGHNVAIQHLQSDYHLVLNPDAELAEDALLTGLSCMQEDQGIVLLSPRVRAEDGTQEFLCKRYPSFFVLLLRPFAPR